MTPDDAHRETERVLNLLRPHVAQLAVHVEALERAIEAESDDE